MLDYWNAWRKAYHQGRGSYHQAMYQFYDQQLKISQEYWSSYLSMMNTITTALFSKYIHYSDMIGMWKK